MGKRYEIVAFKGCPWCTRAYELLKSEGQEVSMIWMERGGQQLLEEKVKRDWQTVPMVTEHSTKDDGSESEVFIGGYTDLCVYLETKNGG